MNGPRALALLLLLAGCTGDLPGFGEAVITVDTDLPVPEVVNRLRVDLYDGSGRWFDSRDIARPDPRDWPVSFSLYSERERDAAWVRLRIYPEGRVRTYRGERFADWNEPLDPPASPGEAPRLIIAGTDVTPESEPLPLVTIDRLIRVDLSEGEHGPVAVTLRAACAGTMARLAEDASLGPRDGAASCVDLEKTRQPVSPLPIGEAPLSSLVDELAPPRSCEGDEARACIPGGATILGSIELFLVPDLAATPERIVLHDTFFADRAEVTVARYRAALAAGFVPPTPPVVNDGLFGVVPDASTCTFSSAPLDREHMPLSCVSWDTARAFCQAEGGDLPSEAQWEHMATRSSPRGRSRFAWGDDTPSCDRAIYGRTALGGSAGVCEHLGVGPAAPDVAPGDVTIDGVRQLAGSLQEWTLDSYRPYEGPCWSASPLHQPRCDDPQSDERILRGGAWPAPPTYLPSAIRTGVAASGRAPFIGFRCVYGP